MNKNPNRVTSDCFGKDYFDGTKGITPYKHGYHSDLEKQIAYQRYTLLDPFVREKERSRGRVSLLELGCADGSYLSLCRGRNIDLFGIDISEYAIQEAKRKVDGTFHHFNLENRDFPFEGHTFDIIVAHTVLEHLFDPTKVLKETERVAKIGAYIYVVCPVIPLYFVNESMNGLVFSAAQRILGLFGRSLLHDQTHVSIFHKKKWFRMLAERHFTIVRNFTTEGFGAPFFDRINDRVRKTVLKTFPDMALTMHVILRREINRPKMFVIPKLEVETHYKRFRPHPSP